MNSMEKMKLLPLKEQAYMKQLFAYCTKEIKDSMFVAEVEKGCNFIVQGEKCKYIFIILRGRAKGIDRQVQGKVYVFKEFLPGRVLGEFECLSGIAEYTITIQAATDCTFWVIPAGLYLDWMRIDGNALFLRAQRLLLELTHQTRENRKYLLLNCKDRLIAYFLEQYEKKQSDGRAMIGKSRDEISNATGFCVKTINRNVKNLQEQGYISIQTGKICISEVQYERMKTYTEENLF